MAFVGTVVGGRRFGLASSRVVSGRRSVVLALWREGGMCRVEDAGRGPTTGSTGLSRRDLLRSALAAVLMGIALPGPVRAATATEISGDYKADTEAVLEKMKEIVGLKRGAPGMAETVGAARSQMNEYVAFYRRNGKVSGSLSFNTLYTAINTLSGHFASYGPSYPVPEKRRKRLEQQFAEIERALARGR